jgi:hypothetical protein
VGYLLGGRRTLVFASAGGSIALNQRHANKPALEEFAKRVEAELADSALAGT